MRYQMTEEHKQRLQDGRKAYVESNPDRGKSDTQKAANKKGGSYYHTEVAKIVKEFNDKITYRQAQSIYKERQSLWE